MENSDFAMMPEELKDVIRSKLPPKSLARCIVVSKEWERSIGDRRLQHAHYQESKKQPMLVLLRLCQRRVWNDGEPQYESFNSFYCLFILSSILFSKRSYSVSHQFIHSSNKASNWLLWFPNSSDVPLHP